VQPIKMVLYLYLYLQIKKKTYWSSQSKWYYIFICIYKLKKKNIVIENELLIFKFIINLVWSHKDVNTLPQLQKQINQHYPSLTDLLDQGTNLHNSHLLLCNINKYTILILNSIKIRGYVSCIRQYL
jgi:hypothetical protein